MLIRQFIIVTAGLLILSGCQTTDLPSETLTSEYSDCEDTTFKLRARLAACYAYIKAEKNPLPRAHALQIRADIYLSIGNPHLAWADMLSIFEDAPDYIERIKNYRIVRTNKSYRSNANRKYWYSKYVVRKNNLFSNKPKNIHLLKGAYWFKKQKYYNAISELTETILLNPTNFMAFSVRGTCFLNVERYKSAVKDFEEVIKLNPQNAIAYNGLALSLYKLGKYVEAQKNIEIALRQDPNLHGAAETSELIARELRH